MYFNYYYNFKGHYILQDKEYFKIKKFDFIQIKYIEIKFFYKKELKKINLISFLLLNF